jgi:hypothetical protein
MMTDFQRSLDIDRITSSPVSGLRVQLRPRLPPPTWRPPPTGCTIPQAPAAHIFFCRDWPRVCDSITTIRCQFGHTRSDP